MTFTKETQEAYCSRENPAEKVILEKDKMGLVQAIKILCSLRDGLSFVRVKSLALAKQHICETL